MPDLTNITFPTPKNWQDFERLCRALFATHWRDDSTMRHGRSGQRQHGVDIYGRINGEGQFHGVQCKGRDANFGKAVSIKELREEVELARNFEPPLEHFSLVTTIDDDTNIQAEARRLTIAHEEEGLFSVDVIGWSHLEGMLATYPDVAKTHYPEFWQSQTGWHDETAHSESLHQWANCGTIRTAGGVERALRLDEIYVHREREEHALNTEIQATSNDSTGAWLSIVGEAGHGKTSLLWQLAHSEAFSERPLLCIAAQIIDEGWMLITDWLNRNPRGVVLLDTLDLWVEASTTDVEAMIAEVHRHGALLITTCRPVEHRLLSLTPERTLMLGSFTAEECKAAIEVYVKICYPTFSKEQQVTQGNHLWTLLDGRRSVQELSFEPLLLAMMFQSYVPKSIPPDINTQKVYDGFLESRVLADRTVLNTEMGQQRLALCLTIAKRLVFDQGGVGDSVPISELVGDDEKAEHMHVLLNSLESSGVIHFAASRQAVRFFHQTFLEYLAAKSLVVGTPTERNKQINAMFDALANNEYQTLPILKQYLIQTYQDDPDSVLTDIERLKSTDSLLSFQLALEVAGKVSPNHLIDDLVTTWTASQSDERMRAVVEGVRTYPNERVSLALGLLGLGLNTKETHSIFRQLQKWANREPQVVFLFLKQLFEDDRVIGTERLSWLRDALIESVAVGVDGTLEFYFDVMEKVQNKTKPQFLSLLQPYVNEDNADIVLRLCDNFMETAFQVGDDNVAFAWAGLVQAAGQHTPSAETTEFLSRLLSAEDLWLGQQNKAQSAGLAFAALQDTSAFVHRCEELADPNPHRRLFAMSALMNCLSDHDSVLTALSNITPEDNLHSKLIWTIAGSLKGSAPTILEFLNRQAWPQDVTGPTFTALFYRLSDVGDLSQRDWLEGELTRIVSDGVGSVLDQQVLYALFGWLKGGGQIDAQRLLELDEVIRGVGTNLQAPFAETFPTLLAWDRSTALTLITAAYELDPPNVPMAIVRGFDGLETTHPQALVDLFDQVHQLAQKYHQAGAVPDYFDRLKAVPEEYSQQIVNRLRQTYDTETIESISGAQLESMLSLLKVFAIHHPSEAIALAHISWRPIASVAGAQGTCFVNALRGDYPSTAVAQVMEYMRKALELSQSQRRIRNVYNNLFPALIEHFGITQVKRLLSETLPKMNDERAIKDVIRALARTHMWSFEDSFQLVHSHNFSEEIKSMVVPS